MVERRFTVLIGSVTLVLVFLYFISCKMFIFLTVNSNYIENQKFHRFRFEAQYKQVCFADSFIVAELY